MCLCPHGGGVRSTQTHLMWAVRCKSPRLARCLLLSSAALRAPCAVLSDIVGDVTMPRPPGCMFSTPLPNWQLPGLGECHCCPVGGGKGQPCTCSVPIPTPLCSPGLSLRQARSMCPSGCPFARWAEGGPRSGPSGLLVSWAPCVRVQLDASLVSRLVGSDLFLTGTTLSWRQPQGGGTSRSRACSLPLQFGRTPGWCCRSSERHFQQDMG